MSRPQCVNIWSIFYNTNHRHPIVCPQGQDSLFARWKFHLCSAYKITTLHATLEPCFNIKTIFPGIRIHVKQIRQSWDHLIFIMGIPILVRRHLYNEMAPRVSLAVPYNWTLLYFKSLLIFITLAHIQSLYHVYGYFGKTRTQFGQPSNYYMDFHKFTLKNQGPRDKDA